MTSVGTTAARGRAARPLAVLALLLGLLSMHGLASTHHAASPTTGLLHAAAQHDGMPAGAAGPDRESLPAVAPDAVVVSGPTGPGCDDDCTDLAVLCAAVLAGAALLLLLARRRARLLATPPRHDRTTSAPPVRQARPPDPVKELCVSRT